MKREEKINKKIYDMLCYLHSELSDWSRIGMSKTIKKHKLQSAVGVILIKKGIIKRRIHYRNIYEYIWATIDPSMQMANAIREESLREKQLRKSQNKSCSGYNDGRCLSINDGRCLSILKKVHAATINESQLSLTSLIGELRASKSFATALIEAGVLQRKKVEGYGNNYHKYKWVAGNPDLKLVRKVLKERENIKKRQKSKKTPKQTEMKKQITVGALESEIKDLEKQIKQKKADIKHIKDKDKLVIPFIWGLIKIKVKTTNLNR